jgi:TRAP-type C4-dicarboxylate transport system substrate-binding protein
LAYALRALGAAGVLALALAGAPAAAAAPVGLSAPTWKELSPADREILAPLQPDWDGWDAQRRQKWLGIAKRYPKLAPAEQQRLQQQMHTWASLTPAQRQAAREQYKSYKQLPPEQRQHVQEKWQEYQQLPPDKRRELASRTPAPSAPAGRPAPPTKTD